MDRRGVNAVETLFHERGSLQRELLLVVFGHLFALCLRQVIRVADRIYSAAEGPMKLVFPSAGPTGRRQAEDPDSSAVLLARCHSTSTRTRRPGRSIFIVTTVSPCISRRSRRTGSMSRHSSSSDLPVSIRLRICRLRA